MGAAESAEILLYTHALSPDPSIYPSISPSSGILTTLASLAIVNSVSEDVARPRHVEDLTSEEVAFILQQKFQHLCHQSLLGEM